MTRAPNRIGHPIGIATHRHQMDVGGDGSYLLHRLLLFASWSL
ncbi:hypothetical protein SALB1_0931 [Salinisphaera sp. LB1]|nr:hypothetical protein SALB1_0931 [Salinisphaera sp. LB1]